jgi:hypothetical protein
MKEEQIDEGIPLDEEGEFWLEKMKQMAADSIGSIEEAAKQLIAMITVMEGIYAAVLSFSGIRQIPRSNLAAAIMYISPIFLWLISLFFALRVFKSRRYEYYSNSPDSAKDTFQKITDFKYNSLNIAYFFLCLSFAIAAIGILYWLYRGSIS